ncbi:glycoside hydrolase family 16 protein [Heterostelium album PN500]|uniref:Glycoside hydrolase family 16 protein n=1 Tax=Heterostelium pallidum (strain ATCC 26659 / Pp 5 / PN500) TaxID=670386 RepID=D3AW17_HETP5|nr:glycoside hydrolase family 16 protein [Heterostelium album PN500]EFA86490.1 glycoside hydrolase family 16 protein [Heterostelium album PN500]|eukprot:XP_020438595.1 glycoside hydrolase family 16 protein [Heterostelium album PN500]
MINSIYLAIVLVSFCGVITCSNVVDYKGWTLYWSDEFNGTTLNSYWRAQNFAPSDGDNDNGELEFYLPRNCLFENGNLVMKSAREPYQGYNYTSCSIISKVGETYGRFEARMKLPIGKGFWPAFWMLPESYTCKTYKEIDIMENIGEAGDDEDPNIFATYHSGTSCDPQNHSNNGTWIPSFASDFHLYSVIWDVDYLVFMVDNIPYLTVNKTNSPNQIFPNDTPFIIILNVAVGGKWPGTPDNTTVFENNYGLVDFVRIYKRTNETSTTTTSATTSTTTTSSTTTTTDSITTDGVTSSTSTSEPNNSLSKLFFINNTLNILIVLIFLIFSYYL